MRNIMVLGAAVVAFGVTGCKSDVEKVCAKMADIAANDPKFSELPKKMRGEMSDPATCATKMQEAKEEDPEAFAKVTACMDDGVSDAEGAIKCFFEAAK